MTSLSSELRQTLREALDINIVSAEQLAGGDVSGALLITLANGEQLVVKRSDSAKTGMFGAEADGLRRLGASGVIRVPEVVLVRDEPDLPAAKRLIAMEYVAAEPGDAAFSRTYEFGHNFGAALATLHRNNVSENGKYGLEVPSFLGRRLLDNTWEPSWAVFYRDRRIEPVLPECRKFLGDRLLARIEKLRDAIPELLAEIPHRPCLIHGDLWSGNYLVGGKAPVLIDPAAYYGHPEHEWAYVELFGGFPPGLREGYDSVTPLDSGYERRRPLLQLFHILVHVAHFGARYVPAVEDVCRIYGF